MDDSSAGCRHLKLNHLLISHELSAREIPIWNINNTLSISRNTTDFINNRLMTLLWQHPSHISLSKKYTNDATNGQHCDIFVYHCMCYYLFDRILCFFFQENEAKLYQCGTLSQLQVSFSWGCSYYSGK